MFLKRALRLLSRKWIIRKKEWKQRTQSSCRAQVGNEGGFDQVMAMYLEKSRRIWSLSGDQANKTC